MWFVGEMTKSFICAFLMFCVHDQSHDYREITHFMEADNKRVS